MAHSGLGNQWDITTPADAEVIRLGAQEIRDLRRGVGIRVDKEHVSLAATPNNGGEHREGSAKIYYTATAPTTRPNSGPDLDTDDVGRMWLDSDAGVQLLKVYSGTGWVDLIAPAVSVDAIKGTMIDWDNISNDAGALVVGTDPLVTDSFNKVSVNLAADGGLEIDGNAIQVKAEGITDAMLATTIFPGSKYAVVAQRHSAGVPGGSVTNGSWDTRVLNELEHNVGSIITLGTNQIGFAATGTYKVRGFSVYNFCKTFQSRFRRTDDGTSSAQTEILGSVGWAGIDDYADQGVSIFEGYITVANTDDKYELQYQVEWAHATNGLGVSDEDFDEEGVFARVSIERIT